MLLTLEMVQRGYSRISTELEERFGDNKIIMDTLYAFAINVVYYRFVETTESGNDHLITDTYTISDLESSIKYVRDVLDQLDQPDVLAVLEDKPNLTEVFGRDFSIFDSHVIETSEHKPTFH